jgi:hypothetical protein
MALLPKQRIEMAGGKYLLRQTEHYAHIQTCIEEEDNNGYEPISLASTETIIPGSDVYYILFKRIEKKKTKVETLHQELKQHQQP